jgi:hypothetical protein
VRQWLYVDVGRACTPRTLADMLPSSGQQSQSANRRKVSRSDADRSDQIPILRALIRIFLTQEEAAA